MSIANNIKSIKQQLPPHVTLVAITKTHPVSSILEAYNAGHKIFGENKVQELIDKAALLPKDIEWHMIGHLQTNKVKYIAPFISLIHSVDSFKLLETINKEAIKNHRIVNYLFQIRIAKEETKFGFVFDDLMKIIESNEFKTLTNVKPIGVMGMATFTNDTIQIQNEFRNLVQCFNKLKSIYFSDNIDFKEISMGMSDDYKIAIEEGSTMVRIGSLIFGKRTYKNA